MKGMFKVILKCTCLMSVLFLVGCATRYQSRGLTGGYSEIITTKDSFIVTFSGNGFTSSETVMKYALRRASELTIQNGYKYFVVVSSVDQSSSYNYSNTQSNVYGTANTYRNSANIQGSSSSSTYSGTGVKPGLGLTVKCFKTQPQGLDVIDAEYFLEMNTEGSKSVPISSHLVPSTRNNPPSTTKFNSHVRKF